MITDTEELFDEELDTLFQKIRNHKWSDFKKILDDNQNIDLNFRDNNGNYLLTYAVRFNRLDIVKILLEKGSKYDIVDENEKSVIYDAIHNNYIDIVELLLEHSKTTVGVMISDMKDMNNNIPIHYAIKNKNKDIVKLLVNYGSNMNILDKDGFNALHMAIKSRSNEICKMILKVTDNIDGKTSDGETPLHIATNYQLREIVTILLEEGSNPNAQEYDNEMTPLHYAVGWDNYEIIKLLIKFGANVNIQDIYGNVPLVYAVQEDHEASFNEIVKYDFKPNMWNIDGKILLHEVLEDFNESKKKYLDKIIDKSNVSTQDSYGNSCLHYLVYNKLWKEYQDVLIKKRLNIFSKNSDKKMVIDLINPNTEDYTLFINIVIKSYLNRLKKAGAKWKDEFDLICSREFNELTDNDKNKLKKIEGEVKDSKRLKTVCTSIIRSKLLSNIQSAKNGTLQVCQKSYPLRLGECIELHEGRLLEVCTFTGSTLDILIGLIFLLDKHKNSCGALDTNYHKNQDLCRFYKSIGIIMNNRCEFLNFEIVWIQHKLYLIDRFFELFQKCTRSSARFIIIPLGIELKSGSHANYLIYDKETKEVERFEPHGGTTPIGFNYNPDLLDDVLETHFHSISEDIKYIRPKEFIPKVGFQIMDSQETNRRRIGDPGGFCAMWCIWYVDQRLSKPEYSRKKLIKILFEGIRSNNISFRNLIRNYTRNILLIRDKLLKAADLDVNDWLNDQYTDIQLDKFLGSVTQEIKKCCIR